MAAKEFPHELRARKIHSKPDLSLLVPSLPYETQHSEDEITKKLMRFNSIIDQPQPIYIRDTRRFVPSNGVQRSRPRVFSAPSFNDRTRTGELECGGKGSDIGTTSSRSVSEESHTPSQLWSSVLQAMDSMTTPISSLPHNRNDSYTGKYNHDQASLRHGNSLVTTITGPSTTTVNYDPDDPRLTGKLNEKIELPSPEEGERFILILTRALMKFGAPSHRVESQLMAVAALLRLKIQVIHVPKCTIISFRNHLGSTNNTDIRFVKAATQIELGRLQEVHNIYKRVIHCEQNAKDATAELKILLKKTSIYGVTTQILLATICGMIISAMAFKGSVLDLLASGVVCGTVSFLHVWAAKKNKMFSNFVDIASSTFVAFVARGLSSIPSGIFCYSAIMSAGIVKLFPNYLVICGSLELASKYIATGSVKMVYGVIWCLFLGFTITMGSDLYYLIDQSSRLRRLAATAYLGDALNLNGFYIADSPSLLGSFTFTNMTTPSGNSLYNANGCYRNPNWAWYLQRPPQWTLFFLVPLYAIFSGLASFQPLKSREIIVIVIISSCSYAAGQGMHALIPTRNDICSAIAAFVIGTMGHLYSRIFHGTAFTSMYNGIGFLVPSAIAATGGLAQNYRGKGSDHYTSSLQLAMRMIQVALGTTLGLFSSGLVVYSFGAKKKGALWAF